MAHAFLDTWSGLESPIHRAPSGLKCGGALAIVITAAVAPVGQGRVFVALAAVLVIVTLVSRVPWRFLLARLLLLEPLVVGVAGVALFQADGRVQALSIVIRSTLCLATMLVLTNTTPFGDLLHLLRRLRVPALLVTVVALMYRYLFVLVDETTRMRRARASRTFSSRRAKAWGSTANLIGQLFVRSTQRAERIYAAMCARGWQ